MSLQTVTNLKCIVHVFGYIAGREEYNNDEFSYDKMITNASYVLHSKLVYI